MAFEMHNGRERPSSGNWNNDSGQDKYHYYLNNGADYTNRNWVDNSRGHQQNERGRGFNDDLNNSDSFTKFRDSGQQQQRRVRGGGGGGAGGGKNQNKDKHCRGGNQKGRKGGKGDGRRSGVRKLGGGGRGGGGGGRGERFGGGERGGGRNTGRRHSGTDGADFWHQDHISDDIYYFNNDQLTEDNVASASTPTPAVLQTQLAAPALPEPAKEPPPAVAGGPGSLSHINVTHIKQERKDETHKQPTKPAESSDDSSSSSSDESYEAGEVKKKETAPAQKAKVKTEVKPPSSSEEDSSSDESLPPVKAKPTVQNSAGQSLKNLKKVASDEDVVCMGDENREFIIPDDDEDKDEDEDDAELSSEAEAKKGQKVSKTKSKHKTEHACDLCDKKGHTSFECQMICRNCSAQYHSLKNCPNPPNLNIALQAFMEFTMQQLTVFNMDKRFAFPAGVVTAPALPQTPASAKPKKDKKAAIKKSKKRLKKKFKMENDSEDESDDDDDDDDDKAEADVTSESESSESSHKKQAKRKRSFKQLQGNPQPTVQNMPQAAFPFSLMAAGAPYNPLIYPYGAPFNFPK